MIYLDTGCLLKLYFPEPDSPSVVALVAGHSIAFTALHDLELSNALQLKLFRREAKPAQVRATRAVVEDDLRAGTLHRPAIAWSDTFELAKAASVERTRTIGCRSLDVLHCAAALTLSAEAFVTTDRRQLRLATALGLKCPSV